MPKLTKPVLEQRRRHILRAAEACFARDGFHRTTIADICKQAGVSTGAVYVYFPNKEAIVRAILEEAQKARLEALDVQTESEQETQARRMQVLSTWVASVFTAEGKHAAQLDLNLWSEALRDPQISEIAKRALLDATRSISDLVVRRQKSGSFHELDVDALSAVLVSLFLGLEVQAGVGVPLDVREILRVIVALLGLSSDGEPKKSRVSRRRRKS